MTQTIPHLLIAVLLDYIIGDPRWFPHPVRGIGWLIKTGDSYFRQRLKNMYWSGAITVAATLAVSVLVVRLSLYFASLFDEIIVHLVTIFWFYTALSAKDLAKTASEVYQSLNHNNIVTARFNVSMLVGRDTKNLDKEDISKAAIESVAENSVDGIVAPLFWGALGGPVGIWFYKAVNTADSMLGYKNDKYGQFGCAAARLDDLANLIPARLCYVLFPLAALLLFRRGTSSFRQAWQAAPEHKSPNAGIPEGAMAGALNVRLGGPDFQDGIQRDRAVIHPLGQPPSAQHILDSIRMMWAVTLLSLTLFSILSVSFHG